MEIPENWKEEFMLHSWKMMKLVQYQVGNEDNFLTCSFNFPNGICFRGSSIGSFRIRVNIEIVKIIKTLLEDWDHKVKRDPKDKDTIIIESYKKAGENMKDFYGNCIHWTFDRLGTLILNHSL
jgi:hypothetical protein